jgi:hypothetical protein
LCKSFHKTRKSNYSQPICVLKLNNRSQKAGKPGGLQARRLGSWEAIKLGGWDAFFSAFWPPSLFTQLNISLEISAADLTGELAPPVPYYEL